MREYHDGLLDLGVDGFAWDECWEGYRRQAFHGVLMAVVSSMLVERTERGDDMFMTVARAPRPAGRSTSTRSTLLPAPGAAGRPPPLRPDPDDEGRHAPAARAAVERELVLRRRRRGRRLGAYVRLGLYPNLGRALVHGVRLRARPPDGRGPRLRGAAARRRRPARRDRRSRPTQRCERAARALRVHARRHAARRYDDPPALLRGERGRAGRRSRSTWSGTPTATPYAYRLATRYEIPAG